MIIRKHLLTLKLGGSTILTDCEGNDKLNDIAHQLENNPSLASSNLRIEIIGYKWDIKGSTPPTFLDVYKEFMAARGIFDTPAITIHYDIVPYVNIDNVLTAKKLYTYCDSSIWNYYYNGEKDCLTEIINEIVANIDRYSLTIAHEYNKFCFRKRKESYIDVISTSIDDGHGADVIPFIFHSENELWRNNLKDIVEKIDFGKGHKWNILMVDDHATEGLSHVELTSRSTGKIDVIKNNLKRLSERMKCASILDNIKFDVAINKEQALNMLLEGNRYDIILLDYKLKRTTWGKDPNGTMIFRPAEFGTDILIELKQIIEGKAKDLSPTPAGEYNFIFISAYPTAVQEEMMAEKLYSDTAYWFIRRGACPVNTPWLFLYELCQMMRRRIEKLSKHKEMVMSNDKFEDVKDKLQSPTAIAFFEWLYTPVKEREFQDIRSRCKNAFDAFLTLRSTYDKIKYDVYDGKSHFDKKGKPNYKFVDKKEKESSLVRSMFPDVVCYDNTFWEHMQHLVYLTAYGTNRQWPEMWEEMLSVSDKLNKAEKEIFKAKNITKVEDNDNKPAPNQVSENHVAVKLIRNYILNLKYQNSR